MENGIIGAVFTLAKCYLAQNVSVGKLLQLFAKFASLDFSHIAIYTSHTFIYQNNVSARSAAVATLKAFLANSVNVNRAKPRPGPQHSRTPHLCLPPSRRARRGYGMAVFETPDPRTKNTLPGNWVIGCDNFAKRTKYELSQQKN